MIAGGHGEPNPNSSWMDSRGLWLAYVLGIIIFHIVVLAVPFIDIPYAWTITNITHNLVSTSLLLALDKGCTVDEYRYRGLAKVYSLGADQPRGTVHCNAEVPDGSADHFVPADVYVHPERHRPFHRQLHLAGCGAGAEATAVPRSSTLRNQQILNGPPTVGIDGGRNNAPKQIAIS